MSNETTTERDGLFEMAASFVGGATRIGLTVASVPLVLLPVIRVGEYAGLWQK